jgi:two-component system chemotaxis response regulator CheB
MRDLIAIGTSAGGVEALQRLVEQLPPDLPASIVIAIHLSRYSPSVLPEILARRGKLDAVAPHEDEPLAPGRIYVVRPDRHLVVEDAKVRSVGGPRVNGQRPSIDRLFRSSAEARGVRVIGVVLTGLLDDGVGGLLEIRSAGGVAVVQSPRDAAYPALPTNAIYGAGADHVVPLAEMGALLTKLVTNPGPGGDRPLPGKGGRRGAASNGGGMSSRPQGPAQDWSSPGEASPEGGRPSVFSCPECHGVLAQTGPDDLPRFVCRVGHAYDPESLLSEQGVVGEQAVWAAIRSVEERASMADKLSLRAGAVGDHETAKRFASEAKAAREQSVVLRTALDVTADRSPVDSSP